MRYTLLVPLLLSAASAADTPPKEPGPITFAGAIPTEGPGAHTVNQAFGHRGALLIHSQARREQVEQLLKSAGWKPADADTPQIDFSKQSLALVFETGDPGNELSDRHPAPAEHAAALDLLMTYRQYLRSKLRFETFKFLAVVLPTTAPVKLTVSTSMPDPAAPVTLEYSATLDVDTCDVVDGLASHIEPPAGPVPAGADIQIRFVLMHADPASADLPNGWGWFARRTESANVWDGKYSNGYRNHAFLVRTPSGKTVTLRPAVIDN